MKIFRNFLALSIAILAFSFVNVNAQGFSDSNRPSASTIERQVFKKILGLPYYGVFDHIAFEVNGDTVTLSGKVISLGTRKSAEKVVKKVPGVRRVINNIKNLPPSSFDNDIRRRLLRTYANTGGVYRYLREPNPSVRLIVDRGHVTLEGFVSNRSDANLMNILANGVSGVFSVTNNLQIDSGSDR